MGALDRVFRGRRGWQERPLAAIIAGLWSNGEQGVWYDPEGFRDAWNSVGSELTPAVAPVFGEASVVSPGVYRIYSSAGAFSSVGAVASATAVIGRKYIVSFNVDSITTLGGGLAVESVENPAVTTLGPKSFLVTAANTSLHIKRNSSACDLQISGVSAKEWLGRDSCTLYQDASGTLPAYMPGRGQVDPPVGLLLDKRLGLVLGSERVPSGVWTSGSQAIITSQSDYGFTAETGDGDNFSAAYKTISGLVPGRMYRLAGQFSAGVSGAASFRVAPDVGSTTGALVSIAVGAGSVTVSRVFTATAASIRLGVSLGSYPVRVTAADLSVKEIPGNHATQATTTSRPTLSARYNLLTATENLASTWAVFNGSFSAVGGYWKFTENASAGLHSFLQTPSQPKATSYRASFVGKPAGRSVVRFVLNAYSGNFAEVRFNLATGVVVGVFSGGDGVIESYSIVPVEDGAYRCTIVGKPSAAAAGTAFDVSLGMMESAISANYLGDGASGILVNYFDCRSANDGVGIPAYQRVADASNYDTTGFPLYLRFDGVDDSLLTADIDFSTVSSAIAVSAVRKLSDASRGIVFELGGTDYSSPGSFNQEIMWFSANVSTSYSGATGNATSTYPCIAPFSAVMSSAWNLSAPLQTFRVNGVLRSTSTVAVGGGMFQKAPLFIGRRNNSSVPFNGRLYGLIVRSGATPDATITRIERYLNSKARAY